MGRSVKATSLRGVAWTQLSRRLWEFWTANQTPCYHCGHGIVPGLGEIQHLLSPSTHPELHLVVSNLKPCHGGGRKRCGHCGLNCNMLAGGNLAARDEAGRPLPFTEEFIAAAQARRKLTTDGKRPGLTKSGGSQPARAEKPAELPRRQSCGHGDGPGRCWLCDSPPTALGADQQLSVPLPVMPAEQQPETAIDWTSPDAPAPMTPDEVAEAREQFARVRQAARSNSSVG